MPATQFDMECGPKCRSKRHSLDLNAAITKGSLKEVQAYFRLCHNAGNSGDTVGRTALHMSASCGKWDVVEWLLSNKRAELSAKDDESGWTALHRSLFYGQLTVSRILLQKMRDLSSRDREGLGPLDIAMKDRPAYVSFTTNDLNEVYSWGDNSNLTLGHANEQRRAVPEVVDTFRRLHMSIQQVVLCKYHTVFLSRDGLVLTCGHGQGGRLGHGDEQTCLIPRVVEAVRKETCIQVAAARDHTVLLMESGIIYTCGLNDCHQLGQVPTPAKSLLPKPVNAKVLKGKKVLGVCAGRFHTVVYAAVPGSCDAVYTFGLNAGQLGHPKGGNLQSQPRQVAYLNHENFTIDMVVSSDAAVACLTRLGDIYVLHEYQCRKVASKWQDIKKVEVSGGHLDHRTDREVLRENGGTELTILLLNSAGKVFTWRKSSPTMRRCHWAIRRQLYVTDVALNSHNLALITEDGDGFIGHFCHSKLSIQQPAKSAGGDNFAMVSLMDLLLKDEAEEVQVHRMPYIYRATGLVTDRKGRNFAIMQSMPNGCITDVPVVSPSSMMSEMRTLLEEADEFDHIHDLLIEIGLVTWPVHWFILAYRSEYFRKLFEDRACDVEMSEPHIVALDDVHPELFTQLLKYIYTDTCDLLHIGAKFELRDVAVGKAAEDIFYFEPHLHSTSSVRENSAERESPTSGKKMSAFEVKQKKKKNGLKTKEDLVRMDNSRSPIKLLQDLAKRFGVKGLAKRLEAVKYVDGVIQSCGKTLPKPKIKFDRLKLAELYDVGIRSEDGRMVQCHKCIAVARLEYFHSMLASGWIETSDSSALMLPIPGDILETVLDFLYTDDAPHIRDCPDADRLCNVLIVADQLLITVLKEMCEVSLASLLTLKNAGDLLEFASMYNAGQLRASCHQFISLNLSAILESRGVDVLSDHVICDLAQYYRNMIPAMCRRIITPYDEGPERGYLEALAGDFHEEEEYTDSGKKKTKPKKKRMKTKSFGEDGNIVNKGGSCSQKSRERQLSIGSESSLKSDEDQELDLLPSTTEETEKLFSNDGSRLTNGSSRVVQISRWGQPSPWSRAVSPPLQPCVSQTSDPSPNLHSLRSGLMSTEVQHIQHQERLKSASTGQVTSKKIGKVSQKERKKLLAAQNSVFLKVDVNSVPASRPAWGGVTSPSATSPVSSASLTGLGVNKVVKSFRELMMEERQDEIKSSRAHALPKTTTAVKSPTSPIGHVISWGLPTSSVQKERHSVGGASAVLSQSPVSPVSPIENPWRRKTHQSASMSLSFSEIVQDEIDMKEVLVRNANKPLSLIQMEEQAIQELFQHYKADDTFDQHITVERVAHAAAAPLWQVERK